MPTRQNLIDRIEKFIAGFEATAKEPDRWQSDCLIKAIGFLFALDFQSGEFALRRAEFPPELRSPAEFAKIPTRREVTSIARHRANFERTKSAILR